MQRRVELLPFAFGGAQFAGELAVGATDVPVERGRIREALGLAVVTGDVEVPLGCVAEVDHARVGGEARDLADVRAGERVHQRGLTALQGAEEQDVSLLLGDLVDEALDLVLEVEQFSSDLRQVLGS